MNLLVWVLYFIPALLIELFCYLTNPIAALFTYREPRLDIVKRLGKRKVVLPRDYLYMSLWNTHDNAADEWWYDGYAKDSFFKFLREATQEDYDNSWGIRYLCRVMWLYRNNAYGFLFYWFSTPVEDLEYERVVGVEDSGKFWMHYQAFKHSFKFECQIPILFTKRYYSMNIGWKAHRSAPLPLKMFANRFIGIRQYD